MEYYWDFARDNGSMTNDDYPYTGTDDLCVQENSQSVAWAGDMDNISGDVDDMR